MAAQIPHLRVIHLAQNQGKAIALKTGAAAAKSEYLVCIDGDALLDRDAAAYIVEPMLYNPRVGAVTGNPRIRTRSTLVGKIQVGEYSSIIGLIKRTSVSMETYLPFPVLLPHFVAAPWQKWVTGVTI